MLAEKLALLNLEDLPEGKTLTDEEIAIQKEIEMLEGWLKLNERNASAKEKFLFAKEHGFVSENHLNLWLSANDDYNNKKEELDLFYENSKEYKALLSDVEKLSEMASAIKSPVYYRFMMKQLGKKDFSPYGEDLLRVKETDNFWSVDLDRTIKQGYVSIKF